MTLRSALKLERISTLFLRVDFRRPAPGRNFEDKILREVVRYGDFHDAIVDGDALLYPCEYFGFEFERVECEPRRWRHNVAARQKAADISSIMFIQVGSKARDPGHEVRYLFTDFSAYDWGLPDELWFLCGAYAGIDPRRVLVEKMHLTYMLRGLDLSDIEPVFDGYEAPLVEVVADGGQTHGYQAGRQVAMGGYFEPYVNDARFDWTQKRELSIRDVRPQPGELPAVQIDYQLPAPVNLQKLYESANPLEGVKLAFKEGQDKGAPVASWTPRSAWADAFAQLRGGFLGDFASQSV